MPSDVDNVMAQLASAGFRVSERKSRANTEHSKDRTPSRPVDLLSKAHWISDSESQECQRCRKEFALFSRKHHCRLCGALLCAGCCPNWRCPPSPQPGPLRACFCCFFRLRPHRNLNDLLMISLTVSPHCVFTQVCLLLDPWTVGCMLGVCRQWALQARTDDIWKRLFKRYSTEKPQLGRVSRIQDRWLALFCKDVGPKLPKRAFSEAACSNMELPWFQPVDVHPWVRPVPPVVRRTTPRPLFVCPRPGEVDWEEDSLSPSQDRPNQRRVAQSTPSPRLSPSSEPSKFRQPWEFSLVCLGPSGVGKSCLLHRLKTGDFRELERTLGACFVTHTMTVKFRKPSQPKQQQLARVSFWDLGAAPFPSFASMYTRTAHGVLFFLDLSRSSAHSDFLSLQELHKNFVVRIQTPRENHIDHLVLTKADLRFSWNDAVCTAAREWAIAENMHVVEASAKHGFNVVALFERMVAPLIASAVTSVSSVPANESEDRSTPFSRNHSIRRDSVHYSRTEETTDIRRRGSEISRTGDEHLAEPS